MNRYISFVSAAALLVCATDSSAADHSQHVPKSSTVPGVSAPVIPPTAPAIAPLQPVLPAPQVALPPTQAVIMPTDPARVPTDPARIPVSPGMPDAYANPGQP